MSLGRVLVEPFQPDVLEWLRSRAEVVVVDPWVEPERWDREISLVDAVVSRKGKITQAHMEKSRGRLKVVARTGVGVDPSRVDLEAAREHRVWVTNMPGSNAVSGAALDVMGDEPPPADHPLFHLENVIVTPHLGAVTLEAAQRGEWGAVQEVVRVLEGKRPKNPVIEPG